MRAEIITIGTELLLGEINDTNATWMAQQLRGIGVDLLYRTTVGDNEGRIAEVIDHALDRVDVVITSGGLGPTVDDVTREAIARATGRKLVFQQALLDQIADRFRRFNVQMTDNNRQQAYVPDGAIPLENPVGTAPIFILVTERGTVAVTPGVPREMKHLMEHTILPWLQSHMDGPALIKSLTLRTAGIGESQIDARIGDLMRNANPTVGLAAHTGQTDVRITAKAASDSEADVMISEMERQVRERLDKWIYATGDISIEDAVSALLDDQRVATFEAGTEGLLAQRVDNSGTALRSGGVSYPSIKDIDLNGIDLSLPLGKLAETAAEVVRQRESAAYGISVIMHREDGNAEMGTEMAVAGPAATRSRTFNWLNDRPDASVWATTHALAILRRMLQSVPEE